MRFAIGFQVVSSLFLSWLMLHLYLQPTHTIHPTDQEKLFYPELVKKIYDQNPNRLFWFESLHFWFESDQTKELRHELVRCIDTASDYNLISEPFHYKWLKQNLDNRPADSITLLQTDKIFTDAAIAWMKNLHGGYRMSPWVTFDDATPKYESINDQFLLDRLRCVNSATDLKNLMVVLQPTQTDYHFLRRELKAQKQNNDAGKVRQLTLSIDYLRWIHHFHFEKYIVVNIASAYLRYYEKDSLVLLMKTVVGKPSTPTPRFAAWCDQVILYPYWYVPRKIAVNEYLHRMKANPGLVDALNMQVIDANGRVLNHYKLNWASFNRNYFPYTLRQSTGCDNALGVIKFNVTSPYGVYLHDTNNKTAFLSGYRYYSHGCIRVEEPIELGNHLLNHTLDTTFLQSCFKEQKPIPIKLDRPVPVFVVYMPVEASSSGKIRYNKDVYKLLK